MTDIAAHTHRPCNVVTGALGFVGLHLIRKLLLAGIPVVGLDLLGQDAPPPDRIGPFVKTTPSRSWPDAVRYASDVGDFWYLCCPLGKTDQLERILYQLRPSMIYHLAAQSSAAVSFTDPIGTFDSNVVGTLSLLEAIRNLPVVDRPVLLSSGSAEEYGPQVDPFAPLDEDALINPISPYGVSKVAQTLLCRQYVRAHDLPIITVRSFSHTGPGQDTRFVFPSFARQIAAAEAGQGPNEIAVGDLSPTRDFLDIRDVVAAYRILMKEGHPGKIYNVSSGSPLTIAKGLEILVAGALCPITVRKDPARCRPADIPFLVGDNTQLRTDTGWEPEWNATETLLALLAEARKEFA